MSSYATTKFIVKLDLNKNKIKLIYNTLSVEFLNWISWKKKIILILLFSGTKCLKSFSTFFIFNWCIHLNSYIILNCVYFYKVNPKVNAKQKDLTIVSAFMFRDSSLKSLKEMRRGTRREKRGKFDLEKRRRETRKEKKLKKNYGICYC